MKRTASKKKAEIEAMAPGNLVKDTLKAVPRDLPFYLSALTKAGHLHAAGYDVVEDQLHEDGLPGRALIFCPVFLDDGSHIDVMFEIRMNALLTMQQAADECGVNYRTIQRWRDEGKIFAIEKNGNQMFPSEIIKEFARKQGKI